MNQREQSIELAISVLKKLRDGFDECDLEDANNILRDLEDEDFKREGHAPVMAKRAHKFLSKVRPYYWLEKRAELKRSVEAAIDALEKGFGL